MDQAHDLVLRASGATTVKSKPNPAPSRTKLDVELSWRTSVGMGSRRRTKSANLRYGLLSSVIRHCSPSRTTMPLSTS